MKNQLEQCVNLYYLIISKQEIIKSDELLSELQKDKEQLELKNNNGQEKALAFFKNRVFYIAHSYNDLSLIENTTLFPDNFLNEQLPDQLPGISNRHYLLVRAVAYNNITLLNNKTLFSDEFLNKQAPGWSPGFSNRHKLLFGGAANNNITLLNNKTLFSDEFLNKQAPGWPPGFNNRHILLTNIAATDSAILLNNNTLISDEFLNAQTPDELIGVNNRHWLLHALASKNSITLLNNKTLFSDEFLNKQAPRWSHGFSNRHQLLVNAAVKGRAVLLSNDALFSAEFLNEQAPNKPQGFNNRDLMLKYAETNQQILTLPQILGKTPNQKANTFNKLSQQQKEIIYNEEKLNLKNKINEINEVVQEQEVRNYVEMLATRMKYTLHEKAKKEIANAILELKGTCPISLNEVALKNGVAISGEHNHFYEKSALEECLDLFYGTSPTTKLLVNPSDLCSPIHLQFFAEQAANIIKVSQEKIDPIDGESTINKIINPNDPNTFFHHKEHSNRTEDESCTASYPLTKNN